MSNTTPEPEKQQPLVPADFKESHLRSVLKGISWRVVGTIDTMLLSYLFTGSIKLAAAIGGTEVITKIFLYYLHERAWQRAPRGTVREWWNARKK